MLAGLMLETAQPAPAKRMHSAPGNASNFEGVMTSISSDTAAEAAVAAGHRMDAGEGGRAPLDDEPLDDALLERQLESWLRPGESAPDPSVDADVALGEPITAEAEGEAVDEADPWRGDDQNPVVIPGSVTHPVSVEGVSASAVPDDTTATEDPDRTGMQAMEIRAGQPLDPVDVRATIGPAGHQPAIQAMPDGAPAAHGPHSAHLAGEDAEPDTVIRPDADASRSLRGQKTAPVDIPLIRRADAGDVTAMPLLAREQTLMGGAEGEPADFGFQSADAVKATMAPVRPVDTLAVPARPASPLVKSVADQVSRQANDDGKLTLHLRPHGMGLIEMEVNRDQNGRAEIIMRVQNPMVLDALRAERTAMLDLIGSQGSGDSLDLDLYRGGDDRDDQGNRQPAHDVDGAATDGVGSSVPSVDQSVAVTSSTDTTNILI